MTTNVNPIVNLEHLNSAVGRLQAGNPPLALSDLPINANSSLWDRISVAYNLSLPELIAVQNQRRLDVVAATATAAAAPQGNFIYFQF